MASSLDGLGIFRNWKTQNTAVWLVTVDLPDDAFGPEVRIREVSSEPPGIVLTKEGSTTELAIDLQGAIFDDARPDRFRSEEFVSFLSVTLADGRRFLFVELRPLNK